ncbi:hypothetical protein D9M68_649840 [compost metagenome]
MQHLAHAVVAARVVGRGLFDDGQDGVEHRLEGLRDQGGADRARGVAAAHRQQAAAPAHRHRRCGQQVAREVQDVLEVVAVTDAHHGETTDRLGLVDAQAGGPADAAVQSRVGAQRHGAHALPNVRLHHHQRATRLQRPDTERRMRPGGLREVLDRRAHARRALDQHHIGRAQRCGQQARVGRKADGRRPARLGQVACQRTPDGLSDHEFLPV